MRSDGGLTRASTFTGSHAILSGPAGGVVGYAQTSPADTPLVGFDMGGTSTDVSRYAGKYEHVFETTTAGLKILLEYLFRFDAISIFTISYLSADYES